MEKQNRVYNFLIKTQGVLGAKKAITRMKEQQQRYLNQGKQEL
jgi:hypothetical protein